MNNKDKDFLGTAPIGKLLLSLALPTITAQLINMLYNIVDRIYIGHIPEAGALALTGVGVCMPLILIVSAFAALVGSGGAPRASILMGKQEHDQAEQILGNCFALLFLISIVLTVILLAWNRPILLAFGASENTIDYATDYMNIYAIGTIFVQMTLGLNSFITAQGFAQIGMRTGLIGAVALMRPSKSTLDLELKSVKKKYNIILDPIFIFAMGMGVKGGALATVISQAISCVWVISFLCGKKTQLRLKASNMKLKKSVILPCVALGAATFVMQASESIISVCFNSSLLKYGGDVAVGAMTILTSVMQFAMLPMQGIGQGAQPIMSFNYGAGKIDRVKKAFWLLLKVTFAYSTLIWLAVMIFPQVFVGLFTSDATLLAFTKTALRIYMACVFLMGIQIACQMAFTSIGCAKESILVAITRKFILLIPLIYIVPLIWRSNQTLAVYLAEPIADFFAVSFTVILFSRQFKKALEKA